MILLYASINCCFYNTDKNSLSHSLIHVLPLSIIFLLFMNYDSNLQQFMNLHDKKSDVNVVPQAVRHVRAERAAVSR